MQRQGGQENLMATNLRFLEQKRTARSPSESLEALVLLLEREREVKDQVANGNAEREFAGVAVAFEPYDTSRSLTGEDHDVFESKRLEFRGRGNNCRSVAGWGREESMVEIIGYW
jgi:hypothetical protein